MTRLETLSETGCFGGTIGFYRHTSGANGCDMQFSVFVPPQAAHGKVPVITFLSGLTCTEENFMAKAGAQRYAAEANKTSDADFLADNPEIIVYRPYAAGR